MRADTERMRPGRPWGLHQPQERRGGCRRGRVHRVRRRTGRRRRDDADRAGHRVAARRRTTMVRWSFPNSAPTCPVSRSSRSRSGAFPPPEKAAASRGQVPAGDGARCRAHAPRSEGGAGAVRRTGRVDLCGPPRKLHQDHRGDGRTRPACRARGHCLPDTVAVRRGRHTRPPAITATGYMPKSPGRNSCCWRTPAICSTLNNPMSSTGWSWIFSTGILAARQCADLVRSRDAGVTPDRAPSPRIPAWPGAQGVTGTATR